jgi:hypothetical protein
MSSIGSADLRYKKTLDFLKKSVSTENKILDIGTENPFTKIMQEAGYEVMNTKGEDLDNDFQIVNNYDVDCYTSFEIFEHLLAPYNILKEIKKGKLVVSVPLKVWFAKAYWNKNEEWDRHYHEFEPRQFDWLLEKTGWKIKTKEAWASPDKLRFGIRPLLRYIVPSYYFVYAEKGLD